MRVYLWSAQREPGECVYVTAGSSPRGKDEFMNGRWSTSATAAVALTTLAALLMAVPAASRELVGESRASRVPMPDSQTHGAGFEPARYDTLWIFDADFEDLTGDNAGWLSLDRSGTLGQTNYWHKDTIRLTKSYLGDSTWWCGTYDECWIQPRGYGNRWYQLLHRTVPLSSWSTPGDEVVLEFDQRYAMEHDYDYGFVEVSDDSGETWTTLFAANNPGFAGKPGSPQDWDSPWGHMALDLSSWSGADVVLRFRFESDWSYSSQDEYNNPPINSVLDGAWQLDNFEVSVNEEPAWFDDCESPGDNGWVHEDIPTTGQTGVTFWRGLYGTDFETGRPGNCWSQSGWMMAAVDPLTGVTVDDMDAWLVSPPIDISGAENLIGQWDAWVDLPHMSGNQYDLWVATGDDVGCVQDPSGFFDEEIGGWFGGPLWGRWTHDWSRFAGNSTMAVRWMLYNIEPALPGSHRGGVFLNRQRVGIRSGDAGTIFDYGFWDRFNDHFQENIADALIDSADIHVTDEHGVASLFLMASNDAGTTWEAYPCRAYWGTGNKYWQGAPPINQIVPGSEILYYFEATDSLGTAATHPKTAPDDCFEFSILPITGSVSEPGMLLVDKHGGTTPGERRDHAHLTKYYYREALGILGYDWDVFDVDVPSGSAQSEGPDTMAYKYYDTVLWVTGDYNAFTFWPIDQFNLTVWLSQAGGGKERNLLVTGNEWAYELEGTGAETLGFVDTWLRADFVQNGAGVVGVDTLPVLKDSPGGHTFMESGDGECILRGWCPHVEYFDVIDVESAAVGAEVALLYEASDATELPAGVAYTQPTLGYQTVALGFGMEFMMDSLDPSTGYYNTGVADRVDLMQNIMEYFAKSPTTDPTGVVDDGLRNMLAYASPNPFNPVTKIAYSVRESGPVAIEVYNIAGRVVRTLLDTELDAGAEGFVVWNGTDDAGESCASGVYFYRMQTPGFTESRKAVLLK